MIPHDVMRELRYIEVYAARKIRNLADRSLHEPAARARLRLRRAPAISARRRCPADRLERHRADERAIRPADPRRTRAEHDDRARRLASMALGASHYSKNEAMTFITGVDPVFGPVEPDQHRIPGVLGSRRSHYSPPRRAGAARVGACSRSCWAASGDRARTALLPDGRASGHDAAAHERRVSRVGLHHRRGPVRQPRAARCSRAPRRDRGRARRSCRARASRRPGLHPGPRRGIRPSGRGSASRPVHAGLYAAEAQQRHDALARAFYQVPMSHVFVPTDQSPVEPLLSYFARNVGR